MCPVIFLPLFREYQYRLCTVSVFDSMKRLDEIYKLIHSRKGVADIGTDHGEIPVRLAIDGFRGLIFASDVHLQPLEAARRRAEEAGVAEKIRFSCSDGLDECRPFSVDTIVIAGLGGDTICSILDRAEWTMSDQVSLILQPMTKAEVLRFWLSCNGYCIEKELIVQENGKLFHILQSRFRDRNTFLTDAELFTGKRELVLKDPVFPAVLDEEESRLQKKLLGLQKSDSQNPENGFYKQILTEINGMRNEFMRESKQ